MSQAKRGAGTAVGGGGLQGPRPQPLSLPATSPLPRPSKRPRVSDDDGVGGVGAAPAAPAGPVIVYEHTPKVIHARPDEFKALVQRLTGQQQRTAGTAPGDQQEPPVVLPLPAETATAPSREEAGDPLVLTLGKQAPLPPPLDYDHSLALPSPGFLLSPGTGSFLFSPATMQAIHELIS